MKVCISLSVDLPRLPDHQFQLSDLQVIAVPLWQARKNTGKLLQIDHVGHASSFQLCSEE